MENKLGLIGFLCPKYGVQHEYGYCLSECPDRCMSLPLLRSLIREYRYQPKRYSVTEICKPPQVIYLRRNRSYFVNPMNLIWLVFGSAIHAVIEDYGEENPKEVDGLVIEEKFEVPVGDCTLVGKIDVQDEPHETIIDYKSTKAYSVKLMKDGDWKDSDYPPQLNMYKWCHARWAEHLVLETIIKDWSKRVYEMDSLFPVEQVEVPVWSEVATVNYYTSRIEEAEKNSVDPTGVRPCTKSEVWFNTNPRSLNCGRPVKCDDYCDVSAVCPQYKKFTDAIAENETDAVKSRIYPKR